MTKGEQCDLKVEGMQEQHVQVVCIETSCVGGHYAGMKTNV